MFEPGATQCRAKVGLLVLRDCGNPAVAECPGCGKAVCAEHIVAAPGGTMCPECAARDPLAPSAGAVGRARTRRDYYDDYGYEPYYYGGPGYFSRRDYETMEERAKGIEAPLSEQDQGLAAAGEMDEGPPDEYDGMES